MGSRLHSQRRGKGTQRYRAPSHKYKTFSSYLSYNQKEKTEKLLGSIVHLMHDPARTAPVMVLKFEDNQLCTVPAPEGIVVGQKIEQGSSAIPKVGNILPLSQIPDGCFICNIEILPGDGGKIVRTAGGTAKLVSKDEKGVIVKLPSRKIKIFDPRCRAMIGVIAGSGRKEKPIVKAGKKHYIMKARATIWPIVAGTAMNNQEHPHGGGKRVNTKNKTVKRTAVPGQKVGSIAAKRTGYRKGKVKEKM